MKNILLAVAFSLASFSALAKDLKQVVPDDVKALHLAVTGTSCSSQLIDGYSVSSVTANTSLHIILCNKAYPKFGYAYLSYQGHPKNTLEQVSILTANTSLNDSGIKVSSVLYTPTFDVNTGLLTTYYYGVMDGCRVATTTFIGQPRPYERVTVKTVEVRSYLSCAHSLDWTIVFSQKN